MDQARYVTAVFLVVGLPPAFLYWLLVHSWAEFWRRIGPWPSYLAIGALCLLCGWGLYRARDWILAIDLGQSHLLIGLAVLCLAGSMVLRLKISRQLTVATMVGLPEMTAKRYPGKLLTEGIYAQVRHPRYLQGLLGVLAFAIFANHLGAYLVFLGCLPAVYLVVILEERELRRRFGSRYEDYCRRVPRFLPRLRR